ncbi:MAG: phage tail protein [Oscillospiraceae bacterium]|nr:phage tail protein [Oscillospiraceae bacterium]
MEINIESPDLEKRIEMLRDIKGGASKAMYRAMNRALDGMKTDAARKVPENYIVSKVAVRAKLRASRATRSNLSAELTSTGRPIRSIYFTHRRNPSPGKKGTSPVFLRVMQANSGNRLTGDRRYGHSKAFMATMPNGTEGIFRRIGRSSVETRREAISQVHAPGVAQMLDNESIRNVIKRNAEHRFSARFDHEVKHLLDGGI